MKHPIVQEDIDVIVSAIKKEAKQLEGKRILITGGTGFLGNYFLSVFYDLNKKVLKTPCKVKVIDNYITGDKKNILGLEKSSHFKFIEHDVRVPIKVSGNIDYIIHAAGIASPVYYMKYPLETIEVATKGTQNMLELARLKKVKSFLFFSSSEIYGDPHKDHIPTPESYRGHVSSTGPRSCYDESKRLGETLCMTYSKIYGVPVKIVRPFNVYGPGMKPNDDRVLPKFLSHACMGKSLPIHGKGLQTRTYCYITDATVGFLKVLLSKGSGEVYNIGNNEGEINLVDLANVVSGLFDNKVSVVKIDYPSAYPADEPNRRCPSITKAKANLGFEPQMELKDGVSRLLQWYKETYPNLKA